MDQAVLLELSTEGTRSSDEICYFQVFSGHKIAIIKTCLYGTGVEVCHFSFQRMGCKFVCWHLEFYLTIFYEYVCFNICILSEMQESNC